MQLSFMAILVGEEKKALCEVVSNFEVGLVSPEIRRVVIDLKRERALRQDDVAREIGLSRPQLTNVLAGRFGLSREAAARLKAWLQEAA